MPAQYEKPPVDQVRHTYLGLPVRLVLQRRIDTAPPNYMLSWRTLWSSGHGNRRFYDEGRSGLWRTSIEVALNVMDRAHERGMLDPMYDALRREPTVIDSRQLSFRERQALWGSIVNTLDHDWGPAPLFVVLTDFFFGPEQTWPVNAWRKIMIVDSDNRLCTFRGTTTDQGYENGMVHGMMPPWRLDRSMPDFTSDMLRVCRDTLHTILPTNGPRRD